jgi:pyrroline-5-carboxylate reductase
MKKVGIIGYGSVGSMLVRRFLSTESVQPIGLMVSTKTKDKLDEMSQEFPGVGMAFNNQDAARFCRILFLCVKSNQAKAILEDVQGQLHPEAHLVSTVGSVSLTDLGKFFPGKISIAVPSLSSEAGEGLCLVCHNAQVQPADAKMLEKLLGSLGEVRVVPETQLDVIATLTSCAPGLFSSLLQEFVRASVRHGGLTEPEAEELAAQTILGTAKLYGEKKMNFEQVIQRVATKGGITEEGVEILRLDLPSVFDKVFQAIQKKREKRKKSVQGQFEKSDSPAEETSPA